MKEIAFWVFCICLVWPFQYLVAIPLVAVVMLLLLPGIGWTILFTWWRDRKAEQHCKPWLWEKVKEA